MFANSKKWWEREFIEQWEVGIDGKEQTSYFMNLLLEYGGLERILRSLCCEILDWGCALGQGVNEIKNRFPNCNVEGYDFSENAIKKAKKIFPNHIFTSNIPQKTYDCVITSNCLEHFEDPIKQLRGILKLSRDVVVIMVPYNQTQINEVHPVTINEQTWPECIDGFIKVLEMMIPNVVPHLGGGEQLLTVYQRFME